MLFLARLFLLWGAIEVMTKLGRGFGHLSNAFRWLAICCSDAVDRMRDNVRAQVLPW
jgi:hypothetical protein